MSCNISEQTRVAAGKDAWSMNDTVYGLHDRKVPKFYALASFHPSSKALRSTVRTTQQTWLEFGLDASGNAKAV